MELLRDLATRERRGAVVVSHDARLEVVADRVVWMEDGRLTSERPSEAAGGRR